MKDRLESFNEAAALKPRKAEAAQHPALAHRVLQ